MTTETNMQHLLAAVTDALIADEYADIETLAAQYDVPRKDINSLLHLIRRLRGTLHIVEPNPAFARRLKHELLGKKQVGILWRIRRLPARVQVAAGLALMGGFMLLLRRRVVLEIGNRNSDVEEMTVTSS